MNTSRITAGVDTDKDTHTAATLDSVGRTLGSETFLATASGYVSLLDWVRSFGALERVGVEGTGSYGAGLTRYLTTQGVPVVEVNRPNRQTRRRNGKSDPADAEAAARATLAGQAIGLPKSQDGMVEAIRILRLERKSAIQARTQAANDRLRGEDPEFRGSIGAVKRLVARPRSQESCRLV
jgi:transposase